MPSGHGPKPARWRWRTINTQHGRAWICEPYRIDYSEQHGLYLSACDMGGNFIRLLGTSHNLISAKLKCRIFAKGHAAHGDRR